MKKIRNVILDRDGTVIVDKHYLCDPAGVELLPGVADGLSRLARAGVRLFIASNQSGIGRGYFSESDHHAVHERLEELLAESGVQVKGAAFCPHAPDAGCDCRKPATGMWNELAREHGLHADETAMVGDKPADVSFGLDAGLAVSLLVLTGKGEASAHKLGVEDFDEDVLEIAERTGAQPHAVARDLDAACAWLLDYGADGDAGAKDMADAHCGAPYAPSGRDGDGA